MPVGAESVAGSLLGSKPYFWILLGFGLILGVLNPYFCCYNMFKRIKVPKQWKLVS